MTVVAQLATCRFSSNTVKVRNTNRLDTTEMGVSTSTMINSSSLWLGVSPLLSVGKGSMRVTDFLPAIGTVCSL